MEQQPHTVRTVTQNTPTARRQAERLARTRCLVAGRVWRKPERMQPSVAAASNAMRTAMASGWDGGVAEAAPMPAWQAACRIEGTVEPSPLCVIRSPTSGYLLSQRGVWVEREILMDFSCVFSDRNVAESALAVCPTPPPDWTEPTITSAEDVIDSRDAAPLPQASPFPPSLSAVRRDSAECPVAVLGQGDQERAILPSQLLPDATSPQAHGGAAG